jgi:deferrochelatase/peroxidase EfeB
MSQAKGILPRTREETRSLYGNPTLTGYFVAVSLRDDLDRDGLRAWLQRVSGYVDQLVEREAPEAGQAKGEKLAAVAVGLAPSFFVVGDQLRFGIEPPAAFDLADAEPPNVLPWEAPVLAGVDRVKADILFYVASIFEARVTRFVEQIEATAPNVTAITIERGFQRLNEKEPFGYLDGVRNIPRGARSTHVYVHTDREPDEPLWAQDGSYMVFMRIAQHRDAFLALPDDGARDAVIGRHPDGSRLDLEGVEPRQEPAQPLPDLPPSAHVGKAAPRGKHDDTQIFRRGLPFLEAPGGQVRVGLNFVSFQSSLDKFDTVFNDWMMSPNFPAERAGPDALLDPSRGLTTIERVGLYFVPPHDDRHLGATLFDERRRPAREGRLVVRKRVVDPSDANRRFERQGFVFRVLDGNGHEVGEPFSTNSAGRAVFGGRLTIGESYTLEEVEIPVANVVAQPIPFRMERPNQQLRVVNTVTRPDTPYGQ